MFYVDSQSTVTRRDSSLIAQSNYNEGRDEFFSARVTSAAKLHSYTESASSFVRPKGSVRKELITMMFESMLSSIVESWEPIVLPKADESVPNLDLKSPSEITFMSNKKKRPVGQKQSKTKRSRSRSGGLEVYQSASPLQQCWWSGPDERAIIRFKNGNIYKGSISMKCMNGEGRFQWADGTVYLGQFKDNEIVGRGQIQWKDDTWYEGDFVGNLRHGKGLYVDSRNQKSYAGGWHCGTKHGQGVIYYSSFENSYDGQWVHNVRHGYGSQEYCSQSGYRGEWDRYVREGKGLMIWPNHDFYRGEWKNGVMSGYGIYIWDAYYNNTMSLPSISVYRGLWDRGERSGYGVLNLGLGMGSHYKGEFKNNKKHGAGKLVTNSGFILQDNKLFIDDNMGPLNRDSQRNCGVPQDLKRPEPIEPYTFDICDDFVGLLYHIEMALKNIDNQVEIRTNILNDYLDNNKNLEVNVDGSIHKAISTIDGKALSNVDHKRHSILDHKNISVNGSKHPRNKDRKHSSTVNRKDPSIVFAKVANLRNIQEIIEFEEISLRKSLRCYESELKNIYYRYATICNTDEIYFTPVLIRLYLWQFYFDCNVLYKGLYLVEIDRMFHQNPEWISRSAHDPFEKIYFWQFIHSLISVARRLYAQNELPGTKPDTIMAKAFRNFMETDVLPGSGRRKGRLSNGYCSFVPLRGVYELYRSIGEPHTVRQFLSSVRRPQHCLDTPQPALVDASDRATPIGRNAYIFGDELTFITDEQYFPPDANPDDKEKQARDDLKLFNLGNLSCKTIIKIFSQIFPRLCSNGKILDLDIELTFFEFFEAFILCTEESIRVKDEEMRWREKFSSSMDKV